VDQTIAFENLKTLHDLLHQRGIRAFLDGGSLLGCYREGKLIDHDEDTDLGILIADWQREPALDFLRAATDAGFRVARYFGELALGLEICLHRRGVSTDLFFYYPDGDRVWCGGWVGTWIRALPGEPKNCRLIRYEYERFEIGTVRVQGAILHVPADTERFLVTLYGTSWKTPDPTWKGMSSPPNARLTDFVIERDPSAFVEGEFLARAFPPEPGSTALEETKAAESLVAGLPLVQAIERRRARKMAAEAAASANRTTTDEAPLSDPRRGGQKR
jgi:hypothetical protein